MKEYNKYINTTNFKNHDIPANIDLETILNRALVDMWNQTPETVRIRNLLPEEIIDEYDKADLHNAIKLRYIWEMYNLKKRHFNNGTDMANMITRCATNLVKAYNSGNVDDPMKYYKIFVYKPEEFQATQDKLLFLGLDYAYMFNAELRRLLYRSPYG